MKKLLFLLFLAGLMAGCGSYQLTVVNDPFEKTRDIKLEMWHDVVEGYYDNLAAVYKSEIKNSHREPTQVDFHFRTNAFWGRSCVVDGPVYILVNDNVYKTEVIKDRKDQNVMVSVYHHFFQGITYNNLYITIQLTPEIEKQMAAATKIMYRMSIGGEKTILEVSPEQLSKMKEYFIYL